MFAWTSFPYSGEREGERDKDLDLKECVDCREDNKQLKEGKLGGVLQQMLLVHLRAPSLVQLPQVWAADGAHLPPCPDNCPSTLPIQRGPGPVTDWPAPLPLEETIFVVRCTSHSQEKADSAEKTPSPCSLLCLFPASLIPCHFLPRAPPR